jgi:MFS family permease
MGFLAVSAISVLVYQQMNTTLSVYLRDNHQVTTQQFGYILSLNAAMVVVFQFWLTRKVRNIAPMMLMAIGSLCYAIGFSMYGIFGTYSFFLLAMVIITIGEMVYFPTSSALVAKLAPPEMRGRYMSVSGFSWIIPSAFGPLAAGLVMDNLNPNLVWYAGGILATIGAIGFFWLYTRATKRLKIIPNSEIENDQVIA